MKTDTRNHHDMRSDRLTIIYDDVNSNTSYFMGIGNLASSEEVNFMINQGRGLIYVCLTEKKAEELKLHPMNRKHHTDSSKTMAVSIDHKTTTTGISTLERADTIKSLHSTTNPKDFNRPGHVFPLLSKNNGLLEKQGIGEAAVELARLHLNNPDIEPTAFVCEILNSKGEVANIQEVEQLAKTYEMDMITISDLTELYLKESNWLEIIHQSNFQLFNQNIIQYEINNSLYSSSFTVYANNKPSANKNIHFHKECQWGDLLGLKNKCQCPKHLKGYMIDIINGHLDAIVYYKDDPSQPVPLEYESIIKNQLTRYLQTESMNKDVIHA